MLQFCMSHLCNFFQNNMCCLYALYAAAENTMLPWRYFAHVCLLEEHAAVPTCMGLPRRWLSVRTMIHCRICVERMRPEWQLKEPPLVQGIDLHRSKLALLTCTKWQTCLKLIKKFGIQDVGWDLVLNCNDDACWCSYVQTLSRFRVASTAERSAEFTAAALDQSRKSGSSLEAEIAWCKSGDQQAQT